MWDGCEMKMGWEMQEGQNAKNILEVKRRLGSHEQGQ